MGSLLQAHATPCPVRHRVAELLRRHKCLHPPRRSPLVGQYVEVPVRMVLLSKIVCDHQQAIDDAERGGVWRPLLVPIVVRRIMLLRSMSSTGPPALNWSVTMRLIALMSIAPPHSHHGIRLMTE